MLTAELVPIAAIVVLGAIPGLVAMRNAENSSLGTLANSMLAIQSGGSFAGYEIKGSNGNTVVLVGGALLPNTVVSPGTVIKIGTIYHCRDHPQAARVLPGGKPRATPGKFPRH